MPGDFVINLDDRSPASYRTLRVAACLVRLALAAAFISEVAARFDVWGIAGVEVRLGSFLPVETGSVGNWILSLVEALLVLALLTGRQLRRAALLSAILLFLRALVTFVFLGLAAPLGYFILNGATAACLLFAIQSGKSDRQGNLTNV